MKDKTREKLIPILDKIALFFFIVLVFFLPISGAAIEISFAFIFLAAILKAFLVKVSWEQIRTFFKNQINLAVFIFLICIGLSMLASGDLLAKSFKAWYSKWGEVILLFYFAQVFLKKKQVKILLYVFAASGFLLCVDGIFQKITGQDFLRGYEVLSLRSWRLYGITASFKHFNNFAAYLLVLFFIILGLLRKSKKKLANIFFILLLTLTVTNLLFTYSRGAWVAFFAANLFVLAFFYESKVNRAHLIFLLILILGIAILPLARNRFILTFKDYGDSNRFEIWSAAVMMFRDSPILGRGLGLFMDLLPQYSKTTGWYAHNCYLQIAAETGLLGLLSFLWFIGVMVCRGFRRLRISYDGAFSGVYFGLIVFLIHAFFDTHFYSLKLYTLFWVLASFATVVLSTHHYE